MNQILQGVLKAVVACIMLFFYVTNVDSLETAFEPKNLLALACYAVVFWVFIKVDRDTYSFLNRGV